MAGVNDFVDLHGAPMDPWSKPSAMTVPRPRKGGGSGMKRTFDRDKAKEHHGFEVLGVRVSELSAAREIAAERAKPFDEASFLAGAKRRRAMPRVFFSAEAADQAAALLAKSGQYVQLQVVEILKG